MQARPEEVTYLSVVSARIVELGQELARADEYPVHRTEETLKIAANLYELADDLRDRAIVAALSERKLSIRDISRLVRLSLPAVHKRGRMEGVDMSKPPLDAMQWRRPA